MSDTLRISIKSKKLKAVVADKMVEVIEREEVSKKEDIITEQLEIQYQKGFQEGYEEAKKELEKDLTDKLASQSEEYYKILSSFENKITNYETEFDEIVSKVSIKAAKQILHRELREETTIESVLKASLSKVLGANKILIKVNSQDFKLLNTNDTVKKLNTGLAKIKIEADDNIGIGGCVIETEIGNVDGRISTQINEIKKQFENMLNNNE